MKATMTKSVIGVCAGLALLTAFIFCVAETRRNNSNYEPGQDPNKTNSTITIPAQPIIIWFHNASYYKPTMLEKALSSGVITYVMILFLNPQDSPLPESDRIREAIEVCRAHNVKVIWARTLWPSYAVEDFHRSDMSDPNYYRGFIDTIRSEAQILGADYTAVDSEPYGNFPCRNATNYPLSQEGFDAIKDAVNEAIVEKGQLDFILPSGWPHPYYMYDAVRKLGELKIAEYTYYDAPWLREIEGAPYDIFGAYVKVTKDNPACPEAPFFTPQEILERQDLWAHKKGLFIYPGEGKNALETALEFSKIRRLRPKRDR